MTAKTNNARRVVGRFLKWLHAPPADGECCQIELHPRSAQSARILNVIAALRDPDALALFWDSVFDLSEVALTLRTREEAVLGLMERGEIRGLYVGGERKWLFSARRVTELVLAASQRERDRQGRRAAEQFFKDLGYRGFGCDEQP